MIHFFLQGSPPKCTITSPNSSTNWGQAFKYLLIKIVSSGLELDSELYFFGSLTGIIWNLQFTPSCVCIHMDIRTRTLLSVSLVPHGINCFLHLLSSAGKMSTDRALRKQQQLNNLVYLVLNQAKPGDRIVDFCSGGVSYVSSRPLACPRSWDLATSFKVIV